MAQNVVVTQMTIQEIQKTLTTSAENALQCADDAQKTLALLESAWKGAAADQYVELLNEITPQMKKLVDTYEEIAKKLGTFLSNINVADTLGG